MFGWFQRLLPKKGDFFGMFEAHSETLVLAAEALQELASDGASPSELLRRIHEHEHRADDIFRHLLTAVRATFLTPFDRGAITSLIGAMDDSIDEMLAAARAIDLYELRELRPEMKRIIDLISGRTQPGPVSLQFDAQRPLWTTGHSHLHRRRSRYPPR